MGSGSDALLGDFNINALGEVAYKRLKNTLSSFNLKLLEPIHLAGTLLDHLNLIRHLNIINL